MNISISVPVNVLEKTDAQLTTYHNSVLSIIIVTITIIITINITIEELSAITG